MIKRILFGFVAVATVVSNSYAQYMLAEGDFSSKTTELKTIVLDGEKGVVAASATVTQGSCSGTISGIGTMNDTTLVIKPYVKAEGGEQCVLQAKFDANWERVKITEGKGCAAYHGAACSWEGQTVKRKK
ncbi:hypothetical protein [Massilia sp. CT11-137]|uniref:hypothetical protein n=1 Tax=Massilia sp. CT11-137 TaxID=3393901 RepID=UPI0039A6E956